MDLNIFKPKDKEEVLKGLIDLNDKEFLIASKTFKNFYGEQVPKKYYPLFLQILDNLKYLNTRTPICFNNTSFKIKNVRVYVQFLRFKQPTTIFTMFPCRKIENLEHIREGNKFLIKTFEQYRMIIKFLENL